MPHRDEFKHILVVFLFGFLRPMVLCSSSGSLVTVSASEATTSSSNSCCSLPKLIPLRESFQRNARHSVPLQMLANKRIGLVSTLSVWASLEAPWLRSAGGCVSWSLLQSWGKGSSKQQRQQPVLSEAAAQAILVCAVVRQHLNTNAVCVLLVLTVNTLALL